MDQRILGSHCLVSKLRDLKAISLGAQKYKLLHWTGLIVSSVCHTFADTSLRSQT